MYRVAVKIKRATICKAIRNGLAHSWFSNNSIPYYQLNVFKIIIIFSLLGYGYSHKSPVNITGRAGTLNLTLFKPMLSVTVQKSVLKLVCLRVPLHSYIIEDHQRALD